MALSTQSKDLQSPIRLGLPKGRMNQSVIALLSEAGIDVRIPQRGYRPAISLPGFECKILKPQNIVEMLHAGSRDLGFAGADWVAELQADVVELLDTELDQVSLVAAAPTVLLENGALPDKPIVIASEYKRLTACWISQNNLPATFVRSYGATEVFPPEDADCIVDISATGDTLRANQLSVVDTLMTSSTRLYANPKALECGETRRRCESFTLLLRSALEARKRVMLEVNVSDERLSELVSVLPCMRLPTVSPLNGNSGFAVKVAVLRSELAGIIPEIKARGGTDIIVSRVSQIIP